MDTMKEQERSWQEKFKAEQEASKEEQMVQAQNVERVRGEEQRRSLEYQQDAAKQQQQEQDQLARQR